MDSVASLITSLTNVYSTVHSGADQRKHQRSASLAFVRGIHRRPVNSLHKWPVTRKMFPFDDVIMGTDENTSSQEKNGRHFADDVFKCIVMDENLHIWIKISVKFVRKYLWKRRVAAKATSHYLNQRCVSSVTVTFPVIIWRQCVCFV